MAFFTKEEWSSFEKYDGQNLILKWAEIPQKRIFFLTSIKDMEILNFVDDEGTSYQAYAPSNFIEQIRRNRKKNFYRPYFISHGESDVVEFEINYKEENKPFAIFV